MNNEPVAWMSAVNGETVYVGYEPAEGWLAIPLYTHPVSKAKDRFPNYESICLQCGTTIYKPFKELTDEEIVAVWDKDCVVLDEDKLVIRFARAILRKAQEK